MKYIGMPMGMWVLFGKSFERNLITELGFDGDTAKSVAVKAKPQYKEIIAGLPEFEKTDRFKMNIVNCALLSAFVLSMPKRPDVKRLTGILIRGTWNFILIWMAADMKPALPPAVSAL